MSRQKSLCEVKPGDKVICIDEYSHDYVEHTLLIHAVENDKEEGLVAYGTDLTFPEAETDEYISRVNRANFVRFAE